MYLPTADKSSMHPYVCTPQHEMGHLHTLFPIARSQEGHQPEQIPSDLVVKLQLIDIVGFISWLVW
jgi:hypothetical protein